jgi:protein-disulfide isomerase
LRHEKEESLVESSSGTDSFYVPVALIVSAFILSASLIFVGIDLGGKLNNISNSISKLQINVQTSDSGNGNAVNDNGNNGSGDNGSVNPENLKATLKKLADEGPVMGDPNAPLTIVEFSDFSCPYCGAASGASKKYVDFMKQRDPNWTPPVPGIINEYVKTGKARFAFKYFPGHGTGQEAMKVGLCVNEQSSDIFWKYHDLAFSVQDETNNLEKMKELAKNAGANSAKLDSCLSSRKYDSRLESDTAAGRSLGVSGTPTFFINGTPLVGAYSFSDVKTLLESELKKV